MKRNWLIDIREAQELTQEYVARKAEISRAFYTQIEIGERRPSPEVAQKIADVLQFDKYACTAWDLLKPDSA